MARETDRGRGRDAAVLKEKTPFADLGASAGCGALHLLPEVRLKEVKLGLLEASPEGQNERLQKHFGEDRNHRAGENLRVTGMNPVTLEPNVGPPGKKRMEQQPEEQFTGWEQMLEWVTAMRRDQAVANRQVLESLQDLAARQTCALGQLGLAPAPVTRRPCRPLIPGTRRRCGITLIPMTRRPSRPLNPGTRRRCSQTLIPVTRRRCQPLIPVTCRHRGRLLFRDPAAAPVPRALSRLVPAFRPPLSSRPTPEPPRPEPGPPEPPRPEPGPPEPSRPVI
ncbi:hypothetical protein EYF80_012264 [Liparis tanakae]|uniref:Uncharacterized protein n=1 Tax=Liparis tanakae TaxID=230148 RepID=A0A4Z2IHJ6_9TELE|nr:hypothetical protein EYF80_012264 [Liparis tanakae]